MGGPVLYIRFYLFLAVMTVVCIVSVLLPCSVSASSNQQVSWVNTPISSVNFYTVPSILDDEYSCSGIVTAISLGQPSNYTQACVFGSREGVSMARYLDATYIYKYAYARANDTQFYPLRSLCDRKKWCVYAQDTDVLLIQRPLSPWVDGHVIVPHASRYITFNSSDGGYFQFDSSAAQESEVVVGTATTMYASGSVALSSNDKWAVVELRNMGFVRIDLSTLHIKRVATTGLVYGFGYDPSYELAISNTGRQLAVVGNYVGIQVYELSDSCGGSIQEGSTAYVSSEEQSCQSASINRDVLFPGFVVANRPKFSYDGTILSLFVIMQSRRGIASITPGTRESSTLSHYFAFGDSFTSGEGEVNDIFYIPTTNTPTNRCHVSTRSYPYLLGLRWQMNTASYACSGATTKTLRSTLENKFTNTSNQLSPPLISIGVGGNDVEVMGKLRTCLNVGTCEWASPEKRYASAEEIRALLPVLVEFIHRIQEIFGGSEVFIVGYPLVINADENATCSALIASLLDRDERVYMDQSVRLLNQVIRTAASLSRVVYVDIQDSLVGNRLCDSTENAMNGIRTGDDIAPFPFLEDVRLIGAESFHPTHLGHRLMAETIAGQLVIGSGLSCSSCESETQNIPLSEYWTEQPTPESSTFRRQIMKEFLYTDDIVIGSGVSFTFPAGTFKPFSEVVFEVHSDEKHVSTFQARSDGSLIGQLFFSDVINEGYHTIHALGEDSYNHLLDVYQIVTIRDKVKQTEIDSTTALGVDLSRKNLFVGQQDIIFNRIPLEQHFANLPSVLGVSMVSLPARANRDETTNETTTDFNSSKAKLILGTSTDSDTLKSMMTGVLWGLLGLVGIIIAMNIRKIVKAVIPTKVFRFIEPTGHLLEAVLVSTVYGHPAKKLRVIGVTGTNGKTTTSFLIHRMMNEAGIRTAISSTVGYGVGSEIHYQHEHMTTSKASVLQKRLRQFAKEGAEWVVVEASSHGLAQNRLWGVPFEIAVMTNLTHDHLEYHGTFERYREAKRKLFRMANKHGLRYGVVNADDPSAHIFAKTIANSTTYGIKRGDIKAKNIKLTSSRTSYIAVAPDETYNITLQLPGGFNVSNSLAALSVGRILGLSKVQIEKGLGSLESVKGRMNAVNEGQPYQVLIDFASTPDGFEKFFDAIRPLVKGKLVAVFGSAGRRDETKRAEQGYIAGKYADVVIATEEDNRDDDGEKILQQISEGAIKAGKIKDKTLFTIANREDAIGFAFTTVAHSDDMVVLLGKGHEKTIERADGEYPWDEFEVANAAIKALLSETSSNTGKSSRVYKKES